MEIRLEAPFYLLLLPIWPLLGWIGKQVRLSFSYIPQQRRPFASLQAYLPLWGTVIMGILGTLGLSEPVLILPESDKSTPVWVLWDLSRSMRQTDVSPNRQRFALRAMESSLPQNLPLPMGLIVFSHTPYAVLPPTLDREAFLFALREHARIDLGEGTNLAAALEIAIQLAEGKAHIFLVSDGAHNKPETPSLRALAQLAKERNIRIHTAFVGNEESEQTFVDALIYLARETDGTFQRGTFTLSIFYAQKANSRIPLMPYLWGSMLLIGVAVLAGMAIGGWFNVLSA